MDSIIQGTNKTLREIKEEVRQNLGLPKQTIPFGDVLEKEFIEAGLITPKETPDE